MTAALESDAPATDVALSAPRFLSLAKARPKPGQSVPSPCVGVCRMSPSTDWCEGCWRTRDELRAWGRADDDAKRAIWAEVERRQEAAGIPR